MTTKASWSDFLSRDTARTIAAANSLLPAWVSLLIVVLIGWQLAKIIWLFVPSSNAVQTVVVPVGTTSRTSNQPAADVKFIADSHLFDEADPDIVPANNDAQLVGDVPETSISSLVLKGTHKAEVPEMSVAMISSGGSDEKVYAIGDAVASGATLYEVRSEEVILDERGEFTSLKLPREYTEATARASVRRNAPTRVVNQQGQSIQAVVAQNVSRLADVIRPTPYFQGGQQQGYRVYPGRDRQQFAALGLRPGDLIKQIDGQSLTDPTQAMEIFQSLGSASQVSVTVERNGQQETLVLKTEQLDIGKEQTE
jgi:general secretion pathway protein C